MQRLFASGRPFAAVDGRELSTRPAENCRWSIYSPPVRLHDLPSSERPRERLLESGAEALSDHELLAVLLRTSGVAGAGAHELAARLLSAAGSVAALALGSPMDLIRIAGIGPAKAATLAAAFELGRRAEARPARQVLSSSGAIADAARPLLAGCSRERFVVLSSDARLNLIGTDVISDGALDRTAVPAREVFVAVLRRDGRAFAVAHNHPSGDPSPSPADVAATERLREAASVIGLRFLDHVVVAGREWRSVTQTR